MDIPAFPQGNEWMDAEGNMRLIHEGGMTLRDYFAAAALQGLLAGRSVLMEPEWYSREVAKLADAMIAEREKRDAQN